MSLNITEAKRGRVTTLSIQTIHYEAEIKSQAFNIDNTAEVWFKLQGLNKSDNLFKVFMFARSHDSALNSIVKLDVKCEQLKFSKRLTCLHQGLDMNEFAFKNNSLSIKMIASKTERITFTKLYKDTDFTDFYLSSEEGRVAVHRICLAVHSDMFKAMLLGKWKESEEGRVELQGITLETLQQLKKYMYLGTLPEDVRQLLLLATCYLLQNLKEDCLVQLAWTASSANLYELHDFAIQNTLPELTHLLLQVATYEDIDSVHRNQTARTSGNDKADGA